VRSAGSVTATPLASPSSFRVGAQKGELARGQVGSWPLSEVPNRRSNCLVTQVQQTSSGALTSSDFEPKRASHASLKRGYLPEKRALLESLDHFVCKREQSVWYLEAEGLRGLEIDR